MISRIALAKQNTALVFDSCSIFLGSGDIIFYQPQTIQYYKLLYKYSTTKFACHQSLSNLSQTIPDIQNLNCLSVNVPYISYVDDTYYNLTILFVNEPLFHVYCMWMTLFTTGP